MKRVNAAIITIGDELLIGQTIDTNSAFISKELNKIGVWVKRRVAVGDVKEDILLAMKEQAFDCNIIIITGGLGPTADDITKPTLCEFFHTKLVVNEEALQNVKDIFHKLNRPLIERNLKQAEVPESGVVLQNKRGTAPGMWFEQKINVDDTPLVYISLPGVPHEMKGLVLTEVIPRIQKLYTLPVVIHRTLLTAGLGESFLAELISEFEAALPSHIKLAYLPSYGMVRLRLTGVGDEKKVLDEEIDVRFQQLLHLVNPWLVADEDISIQEKIIFLLKEKKQSIGTAESCTGGYLAHLLTSIPGASDVYKGSIISYANEVKKNKLHVQNEIFTKHGAVSEETVVAMIAGGIDQLKVDYVIATSGIMGPGGGSEEKPVGTVWIAVGNANKTIAKKFHFRFDRQMNIELTSVTAMNMLFRLIKD